MWTGYTLERIHEDKVTVMELICASPCVTTMICMSMTARYKHEAEPFDEQAQMARHRFGARGNTLTFPMPWEELMQQLQGHLESDQGMQALPRTGAELAGIARVILKHNKQGQPSSDDVKNFIHQANIRREAGVKKLLRTSGPNGEVKGGFARVGTNGNKYIRFWYAGSFTHRWW